MTKTEVTIINKLGLHARAAAKFVQTASAFTCAIKVGYAERMVDGKSIMAIMMFAASKGKQLQLEADGEDEEQAIAAIVDLINRYFDEGE